MKSAFSNKWKSSKQTRKQRKYQFNAPDHTASKMMGSHLSPELRTEYSTRSARVRTGDKVKIMRGRFAKESGKVERIDVRRSKVFLTKIEIVKKDGTKALVGFNPSNLMITDLNIEDKKRMNKKKTAEGEKKNG